jgi:hypothetical protein
MIPDRISWLLLFAVAGLLSCGTVPMQAGTETGNGTAGKVIDPHGTPVAGARVSIVPVTYNELEPPEGDFMIASTSTDSAGTYRFIHPIEGFYNLFCDSGANKAYLDSVHITGAPGDTIKTISLKKCGAVSGVAFYSSGRNLDYAFVAIQGSRIYTSVDPYNCSFRLQNLAPGKYLAKVVTRSNGFFDIPVSVTVEEGRSDTLQTPFLLVSTTVTALACGDTGGVWIGTANGLANLRPAAWRTYGLPDGLSSCRINCLIIDKKSVLWAGTSLWPVKIKNGSITEDFSPMSFSDVMNVTALAADSTGIMWMGTPKGLFAYNGSGVAAVSGSDGMTGLGVSLPQNKLTAVSAILCLKSEIIVGTMHGAYYRDSTAVWNAITGLADYAVSAMAGGNHDAVWIGTNQGLRLWDRANRTLSAPGGGEQVGAASCLAVCGRDSVYVGGANGLFLYSESGFKKTDLGAGSPAVSALAIDARNAVWVGTNDGIIKIDNGGTEAIR